MGLFDKLKAKKVETEPGAVYAPMVGSVIALEEIPDEVFSQGVLGPGCGMVPEDGELVAPFNGKVISVAETKHAVGVMSDDGVELLMHVGMDTVEMNGDGFDVKVKEGDKVSCGQLILKFSIDKIKNAGYPTTTAIVVTNADSFGNIEFVPSEHAEKASRIGIVQ